MRGLWPPGVTVAEDLDAQIITISPGPPPARPIRALLAGLGGLAVMLSCLWVMLRDPLSMPGSLSMLVGFLTSGGLFVHALQSLQPREDTTRVVRITATHLVLPAQPPVLLESLATASAHRDELHIVWDSGRYCIERLPNEAARWLADTIRQAARRRRALPAQPVPRTLQALRDPP